ncbi:MAG TPA: pitrilysin family protein [Jiangellales bacterium]|nr:pitrilysin family protein [Jiangellales bacterium]
MSPRARPGTLPVQRPGTTRTLLREDDGTLTRRTVLPGGLRVLTEAVPGVRSVAFGIWVGVGSRDESPSLSGATHYLEHLLFKGTWRRGALDISAAIDAVGGELNAFTAKEYTCYYARVLDEDLPLAVDVVSDMVTSSVVASSDVAAERDVVLEEIAMHDDDPGDTVHDVFAGRLWGDSPLGRPILGTVESIGSLSRTSLHGYYRRRYRSPRIVVAAAGSLDHARVVALVRSAFGAAGFLDDDAEPAPPRVGGRAPRAYGGVHLLERRTEQANLVLGVPGVSRTDPRRFALGVLNGALGGGMSSRLFQEVREKRGLAYSVYSYASQYADAGLLGVYVGCLPRKVDQVLDVCRDELGAVAARGITDEELARGKGQLRGALVLGLEDTGSRMSRIAKADLVYGELPGVGELLRRIDAVTLDDVRAVAADLLGRQPSLAVIGPFDDASRFDRAVAS